jgi:hypothetical protein
MRHILGINLYRRKQIKTEQNGNNVLANRDIFRIGD